MQHRAPEIRSQAVAPLWLGLAITWLGSLGTGAATNGVYFLADQMHAFSRSANLWLGVFFGATFIPAAYFSGRITRWLERTLGLSERAILVVVLGSITLSCVFAGVVPRAWAIWFFVACFSPLTGMLWPLVEAFVSGGRRGQTLRVATGRFNLSWASATFLSYWLMEPALEHDPGMVFFGLAGAHLIAMLFALVLPRYPARHGSAAHEHDEREIERYRQLLAGSRLLLMGSYILLSAMTPVLPTRLRALGLVESDRVLYASAWMGARVLAFVLMERWHGWHGRRATLVASSLMMAIGFAGVLLAPGVWGVVAALSVLGVGIGVAYAAALYYAMEVGDAQVDAGGAHEATIGIGYMGGPLAALGASGAAGAGLIAFEQVDRWTLVSVGGVALVIACFAFASVRRCARA